MPFFVPMLQRCTFLILLLLVGFSTFAQLTEISLDDQGNPNEPTVCIARSGDSIIYAASNIQNFYSINTNGHLVAKQRATSPLGVYGDPVLHWSDNHLYFTHLSKTDGKSYGEWFDRIIVQRIDQIKPWSEKSYGVGYNDGKMQDKPWLSSDNGSSEYSNSIYVTWTEFDKYDSDNSDDHSRIRFSYLKEGSTTFSDAITISDTVGDCLDSDNTLEGVTTAVDSSGNIYAIWAGHNNIYFDKSLDGGRTWGEDKIIAEQVNGWDMNMPNIMRANGMPFILADTARDLLYVCWSDERNGNADIWLKTSADRGKSWSEAIQLNLDKTNTHQYFPNMAIDDSTGKVYVAYYDFKSSNTNTFYSISLASYSPSGQIDNVQLTPFVTALPGTTTFFGDYIDIDIHNDRLAVVYTSYDLSQKTQVNLITEATLGDGIFSKIAINNTPALVKNGDSLTVVLNVEHPHKTKIKIHIAENGKTHRYKLKTAYHGARTGWDQKLATLKIEEKSQITYIKYRIRDLAVRNVYKRIIRLD